MDKHRRAEIDQMMQKVATQDITIPPSAVVNRLPDKWDLVGDRRQDGGGFGGKSNGFPSGDFRD